MYRLAVTVFISALFFGVGCGKADETSGSDELTIGEADSFIYMARTTETKGDELEGSVSGEVVRIKGSTEEKVANFRIPYPSYSEAGIYPDGRFFYVGGVAREIPEEGSVLRFLTVFEIGNSDKPIVKYENEYARDGLRDYGFYKNTLYFIDWFYSPGVLHRVNHEKGVVTEVYSGLNLEFAPEEGALYFTEFGPDNSRNILAFPPDSNGDHPVELEPLEWIARGGDGCGYDIDYKMDLLTGNMKKLWSAEASSVLEEEGKPAGLLNAEKAIDGDLSTAWVEGVDGPGIGESLTVDFGRDIAIYAVSMVPGFAKNAGTYYGNNRVKKARFEMSDGSVYEHEFDDAPRLHKVGFIEVTGPEKPAAIHTSRVKITILEVYPGDRWDDTCISEFSTNSGWEKRDE